MHGSLDKLLTIVWLSTSLIEGNLDALIDIVSFVVQVFISQYDKFHQVPILELFGTNSGKI
jgi:hypothetical protein